jgi:outer membrane biosynthesis protein TonB
MDLEAQEGTQNFHSDTRSKFKSFFTLSLFIHFLGLSFFFFYKNPSSQLLEKKIIIHLSGRQKTQKLKQADLSNHTKSAHTKSATLSPPTGFSQSSDSALASTSSFETDYPRLSRIFKEQGEVIFKINKSNSKTAIDFKMIKSSNFKRLDHAAEEALETNKTQILAMVQDQNIEHIRFEFKLNPKEL